MKCSLLAASALVVLPQLYAQNFPEGPGKNEFEDACSACHGADVVFGKAGSGAFWQNTVDTMRRRGASGSENDFALVVKYLSKYFGVLVFVNTAPANTMVSDLEITIGEADAIVKYRTDKGQIKDWAALSNVQGLDIKKLEPVKSRIKFF